NPPYGALIDYYFTKAPKGDVTITIADQSGKVVRTLDGVARQPGLNRVAWDLRYEGAWRPDTSAFRTRARRDTTPAAGPAATPPGQVTIDTARIRTQRGAAGGGRAEAESEGSRFRRSQGPLVLPGTYTVTLVADGQRMSKQVQVKMDPRVQIAEADLKAQLAASMSMRELTSRVQHILYHTNDLMRQLTALSTQLQRSVSPNNGDYGAAGAPTPAGLSEVKATLEKLQQFRDTLLTRPVQGLGYRQYPRLLEEVQRLYRSIESPVSKPTDPDMRRMGELVEETNTAQGMLDQIIATDIATINQMMKKNPRIIAGGPIM
ncbi:MAG TPA: hypothetical protein VFJ96_13890, partial [Gemmatimonadaceae bacterium]|nr:hypothetical protein [Gemmatimonadaceae bacterium]